MGQFLREYVLFWVILTANLVANCAIDESESQLIGSGSDKRSICCGKVSAVHLNLVCTYDDGSSSSSARDIFASRVLCTICELSIKCIEPNNVVSSTHRLPTLSILCVYVRSCRVVAVDMLACLFALPLSSSSMSLLLLPPPQSPRTVLYVRRVCVRIGPYGGGLVCGDVDTSRYSAIFFDKVFFSYLNGNHMKCA